MIDESVIVIPFAPVAEMCDCDYCKTEHKTRRGVSIQTFFNVTMTECSVCFSLQPCISNEYMYRCADWHACHVRQIENKSDAPRLTPADYAGLLDRMETQQADMERLKRIEAAAITFVQANEAFNNVQNDYTAPIWDSAMDALIALVKPHCAI